MPRHEVPSIATSHLSGLVGSVLASAAELGRVQNAWARGWTTFAPAADLTSSVTARRVADWIELGLVRAPKISLLRDGRRVPTDAFTQSRRFYGRLEHGFPDTERVAVLFDEGCSIQLFPVDSWDEQLAALCAKLAEAMRTRAHVVVFKSPPGVAGRRPHSDGSHVFAVQCEGAKEWEIGDLGAGDSAAAQVRLSAGEGLYIAPGIQHRAVAADRDSLHISLTLDDPTPRELLAAWVGRVVETLPKDASLGSDREGRLRATKEWQALLARSLEEEDPSQLLAKIETTWLEPKGYESSP